MLRLLEHTPAAQSIVPVSRLQAMLNTYQQDWLTGVVQIAWAADTRTLLLLVDGKIVSAYLLTEETRKAISPSDLSAHMSAETLTVRALTLPREGVHTVKSLLEWYPPAEIASVETSALEGQLNAWSTREIPGVVHLIWPDAKGFVMLPGNTPPEQALFMTERRVEYGRAGLDAIHSHSEGPCTLAYYMAPADIAAMREVSLLQKAFDSLVNAVIQRYTEIVGSHMARALILDLNAHTHASGWNIRLSTTGVADDQEFRNPDAAAQAYRSLLNDLMAHMAIVIGKRLAGALVLEASIQLGSAVQKAIQTHSLIPTTTIRRDLYGRSV